LDVLISYTRFNVITLTLGSQPWQGLARVQNKRETREAHLIPPRVQESVREWTFTFPSELPFRELDSQWTLESLGIDYRGQNPLDWRFLYIIGKLLKSYWNLDVKMGSHDPFGHLKHKLWPKKRLGVKLAIWLPTIKSQESTWFPRVQVACNIPLKALEEG